MMHPADLDIAAAAAALRDGTLTSVALVQASLDRIAARDPEIGAFVYLAAEDALRAAAAADAALAAGHDLGSLHGIPCAVKDVFDVAGWPVRFGCGHFRERVAEHSSEAVDACIAAGAIPLGLVATYELATVGPDRTSLYPQPRNPWRRDHVTGGSSSGSAAAIASGMVRFALGSDTGGSARSPAAYCGVTGFKPTAERIGKAGLMPLAPSMDQVGILAASAQDAAQVFGALTGDSDETPMAGARVAYGRNWGEGDAPVILSLLDDAAAALSLAGARITVADLPDYPSIEQAGADILLSEQVQSHWHVVEKDEAHVGKMAYASLNSGIGISPETLAKARAIAAAFTDEIDALMSTQDALIIPTTMTTAPLFSDFDTGGPVWTEMRTIPFNLSGHPALSVPIGFSDGLPLAMQIVGARGADALVLKIGAAFEAATDHSAQRPYLA